jgi:hypothetical protein
MAGMLDTRSTNIAYEIGRTKSSRNLGANLLGERIDEDYDD